MNNLDSIVSPHSQPTDVASGSFLKRETPELSNSAQGVQKKIRRHTGRAIQDFTMIQEGDLIMACMSGGADSYTMLDTLQYFKRVAPVKFDVIAVNLDQKQPGFPEDVLPRYFTERQIPFRIIEQDTYSIVKEKIAPGKTTCSLCSRLRRGILYRTARELGATKIALGHHRDDILQTLLLNMFFGGRIKTMPPKLKSDDGSNIVIRPLAYCKEADIKRYAAAMQFPIIPCNLCGSQPNLQRQAMKALLEQWDRDHPQRLRSMMSAMSNVVPSHLLDRTLFDFQNFEGIASADEPGDLLFDRDDTLDMFQNTIVID